MMNLTPAVFDDEPTTSMSSDEIALLVDDELLSFCEVHCWTPEAKFHRTTVGRLFHLAGSSLRGDCLPEWITVRPVIMNALIQVARNGLDARRRCT